MKCTIFGGGGFIGSAIIDRLLKDKHELRIFERPRVEPFRDFEEDESVEWLTGDILSSHDVNEAVAGSDVIFHLVSTTLPKSSNNDPIYDVQTNIVASLHILNAMVAYKVPRIIFISSGGTVYGTPIELPISEHHPTDPHVSYGVTKLAIEKYVLMYQRLHGIRSIIMRVANPYGERQRLETAQGAVGIFMHKAINGLPVDIWGDGSVVRDYLHISDVAEAFVKAIHYAGDASIFNISSGVGVSLNELLGQIESVLNTSIIRNYSPGRAYDLPVTVLSNTLAARELGWKPEISFKEGLVRTAAWIREKN